MDKKYSRNKNKLSRNKNKLSRNKNKLSRNKNKLSGNKNKLSRNKNKLSGNKNKLSRNKNKLSRNKNKLSRNKNKLSRNKNKLSRNKNKLSRNKNKLSRNKRTSYGNIKKGGFHNGHPLPTLLPNTSFELFQKSAGNILGQPMSINDIIAITKVQVLKYNDSDNIRGTSLDSLEKEFVNQYDGNQYDGDQYDGNQFIEHTSLLSDIGVDSMVTQLLGDNNKKYQSPLKDILQQMIEMSNGPRVNRKLLLHTRELCNITIDEQFITNIVKIALSVINQPNDIFNQNAGVKKKGWVGGAGEGEQASWSWLQRQQVEEAAAVAATAGRETMWEHEERMVALQRAAEDRGMDAAVTVEGESHAPWLRPPHPTEVVLFGAAYPRAITIAFNCLNYLFNYPLVGDSTPHPMGLVVTGVSLVISNYAVWPHVGISQITCLIVIILLRIVRHVVF